MTLDRNLGYDIPAGFQMDVERLQEFEQGLDPLSPGRSKIPARILGFGEISTVFEIQVEGLRGMAFKRLSIFQTPEEMERYRATYAEYSRLLQEDIGIRLPTNGYAAFLNPTGRPIFYIIQQMLPPTSIGNAALQALPPAGAASLFQRILHELRKVWDFNRRQSPRQVAIDGQLSNWAIGNFDPGQSTVEAQSALYYMDTSTPLFRIEGVEQLDPELFLRNAPSFLAGLMRLFFLDEVINRYYDFRSVVVDLIANFYKEQKPELIPDLIRLGNDFFATEAAAYEVKPVSGQEVLAYYREDARIWSLYLASRRLDRFIQTKVLGRRYPYILPGKIKR